MKVLVQPLKGEACIKIGLLSLLATVALDMNDTTAIMTSFMDACRPGYGRWLANPMRVSPFQHCEMPRIGDWY